MSTSVIDTLSEHHPLRSDPHRPWPYKVMIALRASGSRRPVEHSVYYIRARSFEQAESAALRIAREIPRRKDGRRLIASRPTMCRPLDLADRIGANQ